MVKKQRDILLKILVDGKWMCLKTSSRNGHEKLREMKLQSWQLLSSRRKTKAINSETINNF